MQWVLKARPEKVYRAFTDPNAYATRISTHTFVNPIVAMLVGWAIGGEVLTWGMLIATVLIVVSVWLILFRESAVPVDSVKEAAGEP